jgi:methyl-accepting chemotaxis protein
VNERAAVLALHDSYDGLFTSLSDTVNTLYDELTSLEEKINNNTEEYNSSSNVLSAEIDDFNARAENNGFTSEAQFNQERAALVARSSQLDDGRATINNDIASYNRIYARYQDAASQIEVLNKSIDSFEVLEPSPSL